MRKRFFASAISLTLAAALMLSDAGVVLAAAPQTAIEDIAEVATAGDATAELVEDVVDAEEESDSTEVDDLISAIVDETETEEVSEETTEVAETADVEEVDSEVATTETDTADEEELLEELSIVKASIADIKAQSLSVQSWSNSSLYISAQIAGYSYDVYINGKQYGSRYYMPDYTRYEYTDAAGNTVYSYYSSYQSVTANIGLLPGTKYTVMIIPYDENGKAGTSSTASITKDAIKPELYSCYSSYTTAATGYRLPTTHLSWSSYSSYDNITYVIERSLKKKGTYTKVATLSKDTTSYTDTTVAPGKTYYYRVKVVAAKPADGYTAKDYSVTTAVKSVSLSDVATTYLYASVYDGKEVTLSLSSSGFASGYEVYRSSKKSSGYKKLSKFSDDTFSDKDVAEGQTYFYKARAYYFDKSGKKTYYGAYTKPVGVRFIMGYVSPWANQTGTRSAKITWGSVPGADSYDVYFKYNLAGNAYTLLGTTTATSFTKKDLASDGYYTFLVNAWKNVNGVRTYYLSSECDLFMGLKSPNAYIAKRSYSVTKKKVTTKTTFAWEKVYGAKGYRVERYIDGKWKVVKKLPAKTRKYTVTDSYDGKNGSSNREYRVVAYAGKEEYSSSLYFNVALKNISKLTIKKNPAKNTATLSWNKIAGATKYDVYRTSPLGDRQYIGFSKKTSYVDKTFTPGVEYTYEVVPYSETIKVSGDESYGTLNKYKDATMKAGSPVISKITNSKSKQAVIALKKLDGVTKYTVYRATSKKGKYTKVGVTKSNSYTDKKVKKGKTYYYRVSAEVVNDAGFKLKTGMSAVKSIKIKK